MSEPDLEIMMQEDFNALTNTFEKDGFERKLLFKLEAKRRIRTGIIALAGSIGAAIAAIQFNGLFSLLSTQLVMNFDVIGASYIPHILGALLLSSVAMTTAFVLRHEL